MLFVYALVVEYACNRADRADGREQPADYQRDDADENGVDRLSPLGALHLAGDHVVHHVAQQIVLEPGAHLLQAGDALIQGAQLRWLSSNGSHTSSGSCGRGD